MVTVLGELHFRLESKKNELQKALSILPWWCFNKRAQLKKMFLHVRAQESHLRQEQPHLDLIGNKSYELALRKEFDPNNALHQEIVRAVTT